MRHPSPRRALHLGLRTEDFEGRWYARYYRPQLPSLPPHVRDALLVGAIAAPLLTSREAVKHLTEPGYEACEDGYAVDDDTSLSVAVRTEMPDVTPAMIDWWFGWHGDAAQKYKLWHPQAHVHAEWDRPLPKGNAGRARRRSYVGRTSFVDEYLGSELSHATISFVRPAEVGFDERALEDDAEATAVCAHIGLPGTPLVAGTLVHHVRRIAGGDGRAEMRSRFWLGGRHARVRGGGSLGDFVAPLLARLKHPGLDFGRALLVHCSQEMSHLATFLPALQREAMRSEID